MLNLYIHVNDGEPFVGEVEEMPDPKGSYILINNPRQRDGKDLRMLLDEVTTILLPWWRVNYIEVMPTGEEEEVFTPFRD